MVSQQKISEDDLRRAQAYVLGIPFVDLNEKKLDLDTLSLIPEPIARKHNLIAFKKTETELEVAMLDTDDLSEIDFIKKKTGLRILPRLTNVESIKSGILQYQKSLKADFGDIIKTESDSLPTHSTDDSADALKKMAEDVPVVRIVDTLLKHAIIQQQPRYQIFLDPTPNESGQIITVSYLSKPAPVYSNYGTYPFATGYEEAIVKYAAWLYKYRDSKPAMGDPLYAAYERAMRKGKNVNRKAEGVVGFRVNWTKG